MTKETLAPEPGEVFCIHCGELIIFGSGGCSCGTSFCNNVWRHVTTGDVSCRRTEATPDKENEVVKV